MLAAVGVAGLGPIVAARPAAAAGCPFPTPSAATQGRVLDAMRSQRWTAADLTGSFRLPDGRQLWLYGDTNTSGLGPRGGAAATGFTARNSAIVQDRGCLTPLLSGSGSTAASWIPGLGAEWDWPGDGYARATTAWVYATRLAQASSGPLGFLARAVDLVEIDTTSMAIRSIHRNRYPAAPILFGSSVTTDGVWTYVYGRDELGTKRRSYVARVSASNPLGPTSYWSASGWTADITRAVPIFTTGVVGGLSVADLGSAYGDKRYVAVVKDGEFLSTTLEVYSAPGPAGPWWKVSTVATPALAGDSSTYTYSASVHGVDPYTGGLHVTWNIGSFDPNAITRNVHAYGEVHRSLALNLRVPAGAPPVPPARSIGPAAGFWPMTPTRLVDTRTGRGGVRRLVPGRPVAVAVGGSGGVPVTAAGVFATLTVVGGAAIGHLTTWPCGSPLPVASSVNFAASAATANTVMLPLGTRGLVCAVASTAVDLVVDVVGWLAAGGHGFTGAGPVRLVDTRIGVGGRRLPGGGILAMAVRGRAGVPTTAAAVALNVTAVNSGPGYVTAWPCDRPRPTASILNPAVGPARADNAVVTLDAAGRVCLFTLGATDLVVDVTGWFGPGGGRVQMVVPTRLLDTRVGQGGFGRPGPGQIVTLPIAGRDGIPASARAVRVNIVALDPTTTTYVTAYPCQRYPPLASTLNLEAGAHALANGATVALGGGALCLFTLAATDLVVDINGYVL